MVWRSCWFIFEFCDDFFIISVEINVYNWFLCIGKIKLIMIMLYMVFFVLVISVCIIFWGLVMCCVKIVVFV